MIFLIMIKNNKTNKIMIIIIRIIFQYNKNQNKNMIIKINKIMKRKIKVPQKKNKMIKKLKT